MRLRALVLAAAAALLLTVPASAGGPLWIGVQGGLGLPVGDFGDVASTGFNLGLTGDQMLGGPWAVGGELGWHTFGGNDDLEKYFSALAGQSVDVTVRAIPVGVHGKVFFPAGDQAMPFARIGVGLYSLKREADPGVGRFDDSETKFGFNIGGGVNIKLGEGLAWGGDLLFHDISTEGDPTTLLTARVHLVKSFGSASK